MDKGPPPTRLILITEPSGVEHHIERRSADLGILYNEWEQTQLLLGLPVWRGEEMHLDMEAHSARLQEQREVPEILPPLSPRDLAVGFTGAITIALIMLAISGWL